MPSRFHPTHPKLRHIAVHVEEPAQGAFEWVLCERDTADQWRQIQRADSPKGSYKDAMAGGLVALQEMVEDLNLGPRQSQARSPPDAVQGGAPDTDSETLGVPPALQRKSAFFGFGPV
jgi:hypothetical protein